jgi:hypothetical protein
MANGNTFDETVPEAPTPTLPSRGVGEDMGESESDDTESDEEDEEMKYVGVHTDKHQLEMRRTYDIENMVLYLSTGPQVLRSRRGSRGNDSDDGSGGAVLTRTKKRNQKSNS